MESKKTMLHEYRIPERDLRAAFGLEGSLTSAELCFVTGGLGPCLLVKATEDFAENKQSPYLQEGLTLGDLKVGERFMFPAGHLVYEVIEVHCGVWSKEVATNRMWMHDVNREVERVRE